MTSRVGLVALKLRLAEHDRDRLDETRRALERVVIQQALEELERALHARYGSSTIVRIRKIAMRWQLSLESVDDPSLAGELARDLLASIIADVDALPRAQRLRPPPAATTVLFADEAHAVAVELADRSEDRPAWFHADAASSPAAAWRAVVARGPAHVAAVEAWLERMECREAVAVWVADTRAPRATATPAAAPPASAARAPTVPAPDVQPVAPQANAPAMTAAPEQPAQSTSVPDWLAAEPAAAAVEGVPTELAGLWYFARLVMELGLAEQLWAAGVVEGDFLAHVGRAIAGPGADDDPSWRWFGGAWDHEPRLDALPPWAIEELAAGRAAALARVAPDASPLDPACFAGVDEIVAASAALLVTVFGARLGCGPDLERIRGHLRQRGRLELGKTLRVIMGMDAIDIDLRRAGIDLDPGQLPWLGRRVELIFE